MGLFHRKREETVEEARDRAELRSAVEELRQIGRDMRETQVRLQETVNKLEEEVTVA